MLVPNLFVANGVASFVMNYMRNIEHNILQIDFVSYAKGPSPYYEELKELGSNVFFLSNFKNMPQHVKECRDILKQGNYDIIHDNTLHISIPMMWCSKYYKVPIRIIHCHNSKMGETKFKELRNNAFMPVLKSFANINLACSKVAGYAMFHNNRFDVIPNVIIAEKYIANLTIRNQVRKAHNAENKKILCTVGRLAEQKNPYFAIKVFKELLKINPEVEYWWIGSGPLENDIRRYISELGLDKNIKLFGNQSNVVDYLQAADVFFLPSKFEGLPVTGIEAQAMGLPVITSKNVTEEMVFTNLVDFIPLDESIEKWITCLESSFNKEIDRRKYNKELKKSIYSDEDCGEKLYAYYNQLLYKVGKDYYV